AGDRIVLLRFPRSVGREHRRLGARAARRVRHGLPVGLRRRDRRPRRSRGPPLPRRAEHGCPPRLVRIRHRTHDGSLMMAENYVIALENVSFRYPGTSADTLRNVTLQIAEGDFTAVVGGNGSAKTTLCKTFNGLVPHYWS